MTVLCIFCGFSNSIGELKHDAIVDIRGTEFAFVTVWVSLACRLIASRGNLGELLKHMQET